MEEKKLNVTQKLTALVKQRKTPIVVTKQSSNYLGSRRTGSSFSGGGYSSDNDV